MFNGFFLGCFVICCLTLGLQLGATVKLGHLNIRACREQFLSRLLELFLRKTVWLRVGVEDEDKRFVVHQRPVGTNPRCHVPLGASLVTLVFKHHKKNAVEPA